MITDYANDKAALQVLSQSLLLLVKIFYDLNCQDLPEFFEDNMAYFMELLHKYLTYSNSNLDSDVRRGLKAIAYTLHFLIDCSTG